MMPIIGRMLQVFLGFASFNVIGVCVTLNVANTTMKSSLVMTLVLNHSVF